MGNIFDILLAANEIPAFVNVNYKIKKGTITNIEKTIDEALDSRGVLKRIKPGDKVAITAGSREIHKMADIVRQLVLRVKQQGGEPFIVPAMGSHGGATAEGQKAILEGYGITEEYVGAPIRSSMETVEIGTSESGLPVRIDKYASCADAIIPLGRIKPHTDFRAPIESGLMKMLAIGLGKQHGAAICHRKGFKILPKNVVEVARVILEKAPVIFGLGILEDAFHGTYKIVAVPAETFEQEEMELLKEAKTLIPSIPFEKVDVLILNEIGKDISGAGMDPNVTGRSVMMGISKPFIERIAILDITDKSHNNGTGLGNSDVATQRAFDKFSFEETFPNGITTRDTVSIRIPPIMPNDKLAIKFAIHMATQVDEKIGVRVVWLKNTLSMDSFYISESLVPFAKNIEGLSFAEEPVEILFDGQGNIMGVTPKKK